MYHDFLKDQLAITEEQDFMLTTYGNPYNPFEDFKSWWIYDYYVIGWDTCGILARRVSDTQYESEADKTHNNLEAMKSMVLDYPYIFRLVLKEDYKDPKRYDIIVNTIGGLRRSTPTP